MKAILKLLSCSRLLSSSINRPLEVENRIRRIPWLLFAFGWYQISYMYFIVFTVALRSHRLPPTAACSSWPSSTYCSLASTGKHGEVSSSTSCSQGSTGKHGEVSSSTSCSQGSTGKHGEVSSSTSCSLASTGKHGEVSSSTSCSQGSTGKHGEVSSSASCSLGSTEKHGAVSSSTSCSQGSTEKHGEVSPSTSCCWGSTGKHGEVSFSTSCSQGSTGIHGEVSSSTSCFQGSTGKHGEVSFSASCCWGFTENYGEVNSVRPFSTSNYVQVVIHNNLDGLHSIWQTGCVCICRLEHAVFDGLGTVCSDSYPWDAYGVPGVVGVWDRGVPQRAAGNHRPRCAVCRSADRLHLVPGQLQSTL